MSERSSAYEGQQEHIRKLKAPPIEVWKNQYPGRDYTIHLEVLEFTCLCPKTGLPDFAIIRINYIPDKWCIELKSFKNYILFYRQLGIFHEHVVNKILEDFSKACRPRWVQIVGEFNVRGGIKTTISAQYKRRKKAPSSSMRGGV